MRVKELIKLLQKEDPEAYAETQGCDCIGPASGVKAEIRTIYDGEGNPKGQVKVVYIKRDDRIIFE